MPGLICRYHVLPMQHDPTLGLPSLLQRKGNTNTSGTRQAAEAAGSAKQCFNCPPVGASVLDQLPTKAQGLVCPAMTYSL